MIQHTKILGNGIPSSVKMHVLASNGFSAKNAIFKTRQCTLREKALKKAFLQFSFRGLRRSKGRSEKTVMRFSDQKNTVCCIENALFNLKMRKNTLLRKI